MLVTASDGWHPGIVGLIAARLKEHTRRPAFAIAFDGSGKGTGSGRSIPGFDLGRWCAARSTRGCWSRAAAMPWRRASRSSASGSAICAPFSRSRQPTAVSSLLDNETQPVDGALSARGATAALIAEIEKAGPYGSGNPEPVFVLPNHRIASSAIVGNGHLKLRLHGGGPLDSTRSPFRAADTDLGQFLSRHSGAPVHVAGTLSINHWNGRQTPQMRIVDAAKPV